MRMISTILGSVHKAAVSSPAAVTAAIKLRNQCNRIIGLSLSSGIDHARNGEGWLAERFAPNAMFFVDVGANVGAWSTAFAAMMPEARGLAFEPSPLAFSRLKEALDRFPLIEAVQAAVSDHAGEADFFAEADAGETSSLLADHSNNTSTAVRVPLVWLDEEATRRGIEQIDFLKIDAEGYDLHVLRGAARLLAEGRIGTVQFEYNRPWASAGSTLAGATNLLRGAGYDIRLLTERGLERFDYSRFGEFFHYSNFVARRDFTQLG